MTKQQMFDIVWAHFVTNKNPLSIAVDPVTEESACRYRGPNGEKCAVGVLLPDELYRPEMDGPAMAVGNLLKWYGDALPPWMHAEQEFLAALQAAHDEVFDFGGSSDIEVALRDVAQHYGLTVPS